MGETYTVTGYEDEWTASGVLPGLVVHGWHPVATLEQLYTVEAWAVVDMEDNGTPPRTAIERAVREFNHHEFGQREWAEVRGG